MGTIQIKNWKLKEVLNQLEVVAEDSIVYRNELLDKLQLPQTKYLTGLDRSETSIDWPKMPQYHQFFFDLEGWENRIKDYFKNSQLARTDKLLITYGWKEPMIKIPTKLFIEDWEGFIRSTLWETIIFSEDYKLIMEVSRDYYLHSNFIIKTD